MSADNSNSCLFIFITGFLPEAKVDLFTLAVTRLTECKGWLAVLGGEGSGVCLDTSKELVKVLSCYTTSRPIGGGVSTRNCPVGGNTCS